MRQSLQLNFQKAYKFILPKMSGRFEISSSGYRFGTWSQNEKKLFKVKPPLTTYLCTTKKYETAPYFFS